MRKEQLLKLLPLDEIEGEVTKIIVAHVSNTDVENNEKINAVERKIHKAVTAVSTEATDQVLLFSALQDHLKETIEKINPSLAHRAFDFVPLNFIHNNPDELGTIRIEYNKQPIAYFKVGDYRRQQDQMLYDIFHIMRYNLNFPETVTSKFPKVIAFEIPFEKIKGVEITQHSDLDDDDFSTSDEAAEDNKFDEEDFQILNLNPTQFNFDELDSAFPIYDDSSEEDLFDHTEMGNNPFENPEKNEESEEDDTDSELSDDDEDDDLQFTAYTRKDNQPAKQHVLLRECQPDAIICGGLQAALPPYPFRSDSTDPIEAINGMFLLATLLLFNARDIKSCGIFGNLGCIIDMEDFLESKHRLPLLHIPGTKTLFNVQPTAKQWLLLKEFVGSLKENLPLFTQKLSSYQFTPLDTENAANTIFKDTHTAHPKPHIKIDPRKGYQYPKPNFADNQLLSEQQVKQFADNVNRLAMAVNTLIESQTKTHQPNLYELIAEFDPTWHDESNRYSEIEIAFTSKVEDELFGRQTNQILYSQQQNLGGFVSLVGHTPSPPPFNPEKARSLLTQSDDKILHRRANYSPTPTTPPPILRAHSTGELPSVPSTIDARLFADTKPKIPAPTPKQSSSASALIETESILTK